MSYEKPKVVISRCLEHDHCRYDGSVIHCAEVESMINYIDFVTVCPEMEIGLGVPREPIRLVEINGKIELQQTISHGNFTGAMKFFAKECVRKFGEVDGFIFKGKSPSCGLKTTKLYLPGGMQKGKTSGLFAQELRESYPEAIFEDEERLANYQIRDHFYTVIFTIASFRAVKKFSELVEFQAKNKYLFMSYSQAILKKMGRLTADASEKEFLLLKEEYATLLKTLLKNIPSLKRQVNVLQHIMGYFPLTEEEKKYFIGKIGDYREKRASLEMIKELFYSLVIRFGESYLRSQTYFRPYPQGLI